MNIGALINSMLKDKKIELPFLAVFSVLILAIFYYVVSMNGVVLGNDPAVHLEKALIFLRTGEISLANIGWTPPLYQICLAILIAFSGASDIGHHIFLIRALIAIIDWLLFMSVYLISSKFFSKKVGIVASILLLMCFPVFEANQFGGYTTVLALAFLLLVLLYTPLAVERLGYLVVTFFVAFALVLAHQLATFLVAFILPPILLLMLIKSRGAHLKVVLAIFLGGGIAFFLYYFQAMIGYIDLVIEYVFFAIKAYAYQIPMVSFEAFMVNFGFIIFLAIGGIFLSYRLLKTKNKPIFWLILVLSLFVPFFFAESYLIGFYMPFSWFVYYMTTPLAIFAAVSVVFIIEKIGGFYFKNKHFFKRNWIRILSVLLILLVATVVIYRSNTVYGKIMEASVFYSTTDVKALDVGVWIKNNYPENINVTCTEIPGFWLQVFSGKDVIAQTDLAVQRMEAAEAVLTLSYELEHSQTLVKAYQAKGDILDEKYVSLDEVWSKVTFSSGSGDFLLYTLNGVDYKIPIAQLSKEIHFENNTNSITFIFGNDDVVLNKTISSQDDSYAFDVSWSMTPLKKDVCNASLYLTTNFELKYHFEKADIPGLMDWINPWDAPEQIRTTEDNLWTSAAFASPHLKNSYLGLYDETYDVGFAFRFIDLPAWGNIGALGNRQIDAVRLVYNFDLSEEQAPTISYQTITLSKNSYSALEPETLEGLFDYKSNEVTITRDFYDYIVENNIGLIVYDRNRLDTQMIHSDMLQLIYSNDRYVVFKIIR